jgi:O-antigen ligase
MISCQSSNNGFSKRKIYFFVFFLLMLEGFGFGLYSEGLETIQFFLDKILTLMLLLGVLFICLIDWRLLTLVVRSKVFSPFLILFFASFCSSVFSDDFFYSFTIAFRIFLVALFGLMFFFRCSTDFSGCISWFTLFFVVVNLFVILGIPSIGVEDSIRVGAWKGLLPYKTQFGISSLFLFFLFFFSTKGVKPFSLILYYFTIIILIMFMVLSQSYTSVILLLFLFGIYFVSLFVKNSSNKLLICAFLVVISLFALFFFSLSAVQYLIEYGRLDSVLTRVFIWRISIEYLAQEFLTGFGLGVFLMNDDILDYIQNSVWFFNISTLHNSYLEWWLGAGLVGGFLFTYLLLKVSIKSFWLSVNRQIEPVWFCSIFVLTFCSFITSSLAFSSVIWFYLVYLSVRISKVIKHDGF